jgi:hypothetical protein
MRVCMTRVAQSLYKVCQVTFWQLLPQDSVAEILRAEFTNPASRRPFRACADRTELALAVCHHGKRASETSETQCETVGALARRTGERSRADKTAGRNCSSVTLPLGGILVMPVRKGSDRKGCPRAPFSVTWRDAKRTGDSVGDSSQLPALASRREKSDPAGA